MSNITDSDDGNDNDGDDNNDDDDYDDDVDGDDDEKGGSCCSAGRDPTGRLRCRFHYRGS